MKTINSYGIVLFTIKNGSVQFLVIKRRISIPMIKLLFHGCSCTADEEYKYISLLTNQEKTMFCKMSYTDIMDMMTFGAAKPNPEKQEWFNKLVENNKKILQDKSASSYSQWEFPKGRKNRYETILGCALREFEEETNIPISEIQVVINNPYSYTYLGYDGKRYKSTFYIAYTATPSKITYQKYKSQRYISDETGSAEWLVMNSCIYMMDYENKRMLQKIHNLICHKIGGMM